VRLRNWIQFRSTRLPQDWLDFFKRSSVMTSISKARVRVKVGLWPFLRESLPFTTCRNIPGRHKPKSQAEILILGTESRATRQGADPSSNSGSVATTF
jgi:hypothetical protein